jgi:hypothetical protein
MKKRHFFHRERTAEDELVDILRPRAIRFIAKFGIEAKFGLLPCKTGWRIESRIGPPFGPLGKEEMMDLVRLNDMSDGSDGLH